jgi:hypothetical protein
MMQQEAQHHSSEKAFLFRARMTGRACIVLRTAGGHRLVPGLPGPTKLLRATNVRV